MKFDQSKITRKPLILAGTGAAVIALLIAGYWLQPATGDAQAAVAPSGPPPAPVAIARAEPMLMAPHTVLPGTVVSLRDAVIASETSGKILSVAYVGDSVDVNDSLAEIDPTNARQLVAQRRAELDRLQSLLTYHSNYYERVSIDNRLGIPEVAIAELRSNRDTAKADVARAKAALEAAKNELARTSIKAPFPGRVVSQEIQPGEYAQVGSQIARLVDTANLEVSAQVPASLVQPLETGTMLTITGMGKTFEAPMRALVPVGDSVSRTMELRVELPDSGLLVGSPVRVSLPSATPRDVVAIPRDAVILRTNSQYVFVVEEGNAQRREVELGYAEGDMIEVIGDVEVNDTVIVRGGERLRDGQAVAWQEESSGLTGAEVSVAP